jgi:hypothetical protein
VQLFRAFLYSPSFEALPLGRDPAQGSFKHARSLRYRAENRVKTGLRFAMRNETLRIRGRKSLKSLIPPNQRFRRIVCFQWVDLDFVSPISRIGSFRRKTRVRRSAADPLGIPHHSQCLWKSEIYFSIFRFFIAPRAIA